MLFNDLRDMESVMSVATVPVYLPQAGLTLHMLRDDGDVPGDLLDAMRATYGRAADAAAKFAARVAEIDKNPHLTQTGKAAERAKAAELLLLPVAHAADDAARAVNAQITLKAGEALQRYLNTPMHPDPMVDYARQRDLIAQQWDGTDPAMRRVKLLSAVGSNHPLGRALLLTAPPVPGHEESAVLPSDLRRDAQAAIAERASLNGPLPGVARFYDGLAREVRQAIGTATDPVFLGAFGA